MRKYFENPAVSRALDGAGDSSVRGSSLVAPRLSIGGVEIAPATVLAPMAGVTDTVFRRFIRNLGGCGLIMTEFTSADGVLRVAKTRKRKRYLHFYEDEHPISAQLFGSDPEVMAEAARMVRGPGLRHPGRSQPRLSGEESREVQRRFGPAARPAADRSRSSRACARPVTIPFTVKFRAGWNDERNRLRRTGEDGGRLRPAGRRAARAHPRTGLQRQGALGVDRRGQSRR